jgi:hypothetical protein
MRALADQVAHLASEHERAERAGNEGAVRRRMGEVGDEMAMWSQVLALWPVEAADDARQRAQELCRTLWTTEMALSYQNSGSLVDQAASEARGLAEALDARI